MTFGDLQALVLSWLDDPKAGYFTTPQIQRWINNAQLEVQKKLIQAGESWYQKAVETYTVYNRNSYTLPADFLKIDHMEVVTGNVGQGGSEQKYPIKHSTQAEGDYVDFYLGPPVTFFVKKNCLVLRPFPDQPTYLLRMDYNYRLSDMIVDAEVPDVPPEYHEFIAVLATIDGNIKDQRAADLILAKKQYYEELLARSAQDRMLDKPRSVVITQDDGGGFVF